MVLVWIYWSTRVIKKLKIQNGWKRRQITAVKVLDHLAHSPDLAPSDFHLFLHLKKHLAGQKFHEDEEVKTKSPHGCVRRRWSSVTSEYKTSCQAKQMHWQKWWLCWKVAEDTCWECLTRYFNNFFLIIAFVTLLYGPPTRRKHVWLAHSIWSHPFVTFQKYKRCFLREKF